MKTFANFLEKNGNFLEGQSDTKTSEAGIIRKSLRLCLKGQLLTLVDIVE